MEDNRMVLFFGAAADVPQWIKILPLGQVTLGDGREPFTVDREAMEAILAAWEKRGNDLVIDYEHQTLEGGVAPAAGWIKALETREDGLWARVEWTERAQGYISSKEYRYFSPVLLLDRKTRRPMELLQAGLTNFPAINHLTPLAARHTAAEEDATLLETATSCEAGAEREAPIVAQPTRAETLLSQLKEYLGLESDAGEAEVLEASRKLRGLVAEVARVQPADEPVAGRGGEAKDSEPVGPKNILAMLVQIETQMRTGREALAAVSRLEGELRQERAAALIREALASGRMTPGELEAAGGRLRVLAQEDPDCFRALIMARPRHAMAPLGALQWDEAQESSTPVRSDELTMCRALGLEPGSFRQRRQAELGASNE